MSSLRLALITDVPLSKEAVLSMLGEKNPLSVVKGLGVAVSAVEKIIVQKLRQSPEEWTIFCRDYCTT